MNFYVLVDKTTQEAIMPNTMRKTFRGEWVTVESWEAPKHMGSTGRVYVKSEEGTQAGYYPSVIGAEFILV